MFTANHIWHFYRLYRDIGIYSATPFEKGVSYSKQEADLHSIFANIAGFALTTSILSNALKEEKVNRRNIHWSGMAFVVFSSAMFKLMPEQQGLWQRILWTGGLIWLTVSYKF